MSYDQQRNARYRRLSRDYDIPYLMNPVTNGFIVPRSDVEEILRDHQELMCLEYADKVNPCHRCHHKDGEYLGDLYWDANPCTCYAGVTLDDFIVEDGKFELPLHLKTFEIW